MKFLKLYLALIYIVLILLLLLQGLQCCDRNTVNEYYRDSGIIENLTDSTADIANEDTISSEALIDKAETIGKSGNLKITLLWDFPGDIDIHVLEPNGNEIYYENKKGSETTGYLDVDNRNGGSGAAENVFWTTPKKGEYKVWIKYYSASKSTGITGAGNCHIVLTREGMPSEIYHFYMDEVGQKEFVASFIIE